MNLTSAKQENSFLKLQGTVRTRAKDEKEAFGISAMQESTNAQSTAHLKAKSRNKQPAPSVESDDLVQLTLAGVGCHTKGTPAAGYRSGVGKGAEKRDS